MPTYLIERTVPGIGKLSPDELRVLSERSNGVLADLGNDIRWLHSYVVEDTLFCVYESSGVDLIQEHARCMGVPADRISEVRSIISPATAKK